MIEVLLLRAWLSAAVSERTMPAPQALRVQAATAPLGFSGATLTIRSFQTTLGRRAERSVALRTAGGAVRTRRLNGEGGWTGASSLNLYHVEQDVFLVVGRNNCVRIDPIRTSLSRCSRATACAAPHMFIGRFDWMNGFDPPHGRFGIGFRYLPSYDAAESEGC
ncbi:MAG TPA: hypothetical protein VGC56_06960 [Allosphingosinicella sp.]|jgi:hypothetical protein